jgi:hypothetical protein
MRNWGPSAILLAIAVICFVLAALKVPVGTVDLTDLGLAFGFGSFLVTGGGWGRGRRV